MSADPRAEHALRLIVAWFNSPQPTTEEQDAWLDQGLVLAREVVGDITTPEEERNSFA